MPRLKKIDMTQSQKRVYTLRRKYGKEYFRNLANKRWKNTISI